MHMKQLCLAALAATASAQELNLTAALSSTPDLSNLTTYVSLFPDLLELLGSATNITIVAPSNDAFAELLASPEGAAVAANDTGLVRAVLTYHVLNGTYPASSIGDTPTFVPTLLNDPLYANVTGGQRVEVLTSEDNVEFISGLRTISTVTQADVNFTGGVIHIVDSVLVPPQNVSTTAVAANLTSLAGALTAADLVSTVDSTPDLTIFAPNNEAFQRIGSALGDLSTEDLVSILQYHVVAGTVGYSSDLSNTTLQTLGGGEVTITVAGESVFVNGAKVVTPDVLVANGVVHVIDNVLNPNETSAEPDPSAPTQPAAYSGASSADSVPFTSGVPTPTAALGGADSTQASETAPTGEAAPAETTGAATRLSPLYAGMAAAIAAVWMM
ncbi:MAG: hypothetical protein M1833_003633 [Piccolia ochrophora]|nr:MAG: hypothetical protein M1833_003633 [Piccolia ochrophora]